MYLLIETYNGEVKTPDLLSKIKHSISSLEKVMGVKPEDIIIANPTPTSEFLEMIQEKKYGTYTFTLSRNYESTIDWGKINILVEKIIQLGKFDEDIVLIDIDTEITKDLLPILQPTNAVLWEPEWIFSTGRNLGSVLPRLPFTEIRINYDNSFKMFNSGFVWIPSNRRKELCEKALWIVDTLNNGFFKDADRICNDLDEQIAFSIVLYDAYGKKDTLYVAKDYVKHYWPEQQQNKKWW